MKGDTNAISRLLVITTSRAIIDRAPAENQHQDGTADIKSDNLSCSPFRITVLMRFAGRATAED
jgi:hypothetical protein